MKNYKKDESMRDYLIRNGADIELVESPIVKEKLRNGRPYDIFKSRDFEDEMNITINEDGTFKFDENNLQSDPRDLNYHRIGNEYRVLRDPKNGQIKICEIFIKSEVEGWSPKSELITRDRTEVEVTSCNSLGVAEEKRMYYKDGNCLEEAKNQSLQEIEKDYTAITSYTRKNGKIVKEGILGEAVDNKNYSYDDGNIVFGDLNKNELNQLPSLAIYTFDRNAERLISKYPQLKEELMDRRENMIDAIKERNKKLNSEIEKFATQNARNQKMLEITSDFVEQVKDSTVGNFFFGKRAGRVLEYVKNYQDKNLRLTEGIERNEEADGQEENLDFDESIEKLSYLGKTEKDEETKKIEKYVDKNMANLIKCRNINWKKGYNLYGCVDSTLKFADEVKRSKIGNLFFGAKAKDMDNEVNELEKDNDEDLER